jgi:hypothetical protein
MKTVSTANYSGEISENKVWFEHNLLGDEDCVTMYVRGNVVTDYEYCYEIPAEIQTFMIRKGYNLTEVLV